MYRSPRAPARRSTATTRLAFLGALVVALSACDDTADTTSSSGSTSSTTTTSSSTTGSTTSSSGSSSSSSGSGTGGGPQMLTACLDRPDVLMTPPNGTLPCELIPPGLTLTIP